MKRIAALILLLAVSLGSFAAAPPKVTTIVFVRHAERASHEGDSPLSAEGTARAKELARVLAGVKFDAIYTTPYIRTKDTAAPTAEAQKLTPIVRDAGKTYAADMVKHIRETHAGQTVLVVGHSNTTIEVMQAFGITGLAEIPSSQFDDLFVVTDVEGAAPKVVALRYGAATR